MQSADSCMGFLRVRCRKLSLQRNAASRWQGVSPRPHSRHCGTTLPSPLPSWGARLPSGGHDRRAGPPWRDSRAGAGVQEASEVREDVYVPCESREKGRGIAEVQIKAWPLRRAWKSYDPSSCNPSCPPPSPPKDLLGQEEHWASMTVQVCSLILLPSFTFSASFPGYAVYYSSASRSVLLCVLCLRHVFMELV